MIKIKLRAQLGLPLSYSEEWKVLKVQMKGGFEIII